MKSTNQTLTRFFIYTFIYSWLLWLPGVLTYFGLINAPAGLLKGLELLGAIGPAVIALYLTGQQVGWAGAKQMLGSSFNVKASWRFWLSASAMLLVLHAASRLVLTMIVPDAPQSEMLQMPVAIIPMFIIYFLVGGGLGEEIGWRGFALDRLQEKHSALNASLLLAGIWIVWHLPLFFYGGTNQSLIPFWLFVLPVIPLGVMLTWVYNNTKTIFAAAFFHTVGNLAHELFRVIPTETWPSLTGFVILTIFYLIAAVVIVAIYGAQTLRRG